MNTQVEPALSLNAVAVLRKRYLMRDEQGSAIETPRDLFERVARAIAAADAQYGEDPERIAPTFFAMMASRDFLPNTPCLANAGRPNGQLSACFVLPIDDHMESIMETVKHAALIHKSGGGTGFSFGRLRPAGDLVSGTNGVASGPISFMAMYNAMTECVKQGGIRRGANMGILPVDHPDILGFLDCKRRACEVCSSLGRQTCDHSIRNFNISVGITNIFMAALQADRDYDLIHPKTKLAVRKLGAREVWERIVANAHHSGEPGLFFIDRTNELDPLAPELGPIEATNPCGEVPLRAYDTCTLGSINLSNFYAEHQGQGTIDFDKLTKTTHLAVHFLDNVLSVNSFPVPQIAEVTRACRKVGLGVMGWADLLIRLGIRYDSDQALNLGEQVMRLINTEAVKASEELAIKRGPFAHWSKSRWAARGDRPRRNSTVTVIAPTGSISIIAGCSSGIEPIFALAMLRNQAGMEMPEVNPAFVEIAQREGWHTEALMREMADKGSVANIDAVPSRWRWVFRTAMDIGPEWHVKTQAAFQRHTEDAVSKTINLPNAATVGDVEAAYRLAWELGCKGITVYRDGSRSAQVLNVGKVNHVPVPEVSLERKRIPEDGFRHGVTISKSTAHGTVHTTINSHPDDDQPFECFIVSGKSGQEVTAMLEALGRAVSYALSLPSPIKPRDRLEALAEQFSRIGGASNGIGPKRISSAPDGVAHAFLDFLQRANGSNGRPKLRDGNRDLCPACKSPTLAKGGNCDVCEGCGYSKC